MASTSYHPAAIGTQAISIPVLSGSLLSAHRRADLRSQRDRVTRHRPLTLERADSDMGTASSSSPGSDWTSSPMSVTQSTGSTRARVLVPVASPPDMHHSGVYPSTPQGQLQKKDKQRAGSNDMPPDTLPPLFTSPQSPLGPSMISSSAYKSVNLNSHHDPESNEPARLITYTKHAQGFTWNDELFLPSYLLGRHRYRGGSNRRRWAGYDDDDDNMGDFDEEGERCPVTDIFVTDEEAAAMMP